jgi:cysteine synthase A/cysteine synthase B
MKIEPVKYDSPAAGHQSATSRNRHGVYDSIADLIPGPDNPSPMVRLSERFDATSEREFLLKLEGLNPFGSIKDRTASFLLSGVELAPDQVLVEPSSGNTGIALAALANARGIPIEIALPEGTPEEKKAMLRFLGIELLETEDDLCPLFPTEGARGVVKSMVESVAFNGKYVSPNQYENDLNVAAHYHTTGPEIWQQTGGQVDYFFAGFGTCGTITGVGRFLKEQNPEVKIIGVEPAHRRHQLSGLKKITELPEEFAPRILDRDVLDEIVGVEDEDAYQAGIRLARKEGIMAGPTTGALLHAAQAIGARGRVVVISPDGAAKYASFYERYL